MHGQGQFFSKYFAICARRQIAYWLHNALHRVDRLRPVILVLA